MSLAHKVYPGVHLGEGSRVEPFALLGVPARGEKEGERETWIGEGALIRSHTVIYAGNRIGRGFQTGHGVLLREMNEIGDDVSVGSGTVIEHHVRLGSGVRIHSQAFIPEYSVLGDGCWLGPHVVLTNAKYPCSPGAKAALRGPMVGAGAKIGANSTLLPGVVIGKNALVGAGSVVTTAVPDGAVVVGNPARFLKSLRDLPYEVPL